MQQVNFKEVRETYACYAQRGIKAYRKERRFVLDCIRSNRRMHGVRRSLYYQHALAGLRQLGI